MEISIITTVKNNPSGVYTTIKSIIRQSIFNQIEYIIVDASNDKITTRIIKKLIKNYKIKYFFSKHQNLYTGINKGIKKASGNFIGILNSGDIYYHDRILEKVKNKINKIKNVNIFYGDIVYFDNKNIKRIWNSKNKIKGFSDIFLIPHPSSFLKKKLFSKNNFYSDKYFISSDIDFFIKNKNEIIGKSYYLNTKIVYMRYGGLSTNIIKIPLKIFEDLSILFKNFSIFFLYFFVIKIFLKIPSFNLPKSKKEFNRLIYLFLRLSEK